MPATLTKNKDAAKSAAWYLFQGATFAVILANTSAAATPPAQSGDFLNWLVPTDYTLADSFDLFLTGGTVAFDATLTSRAKLPQLQIVLDYATNVTYTDLLILCIPQYVPSGAPAGSTCFLGVIHESSPVTLLSTETKTYNVDLFAEWI